ncbi:MAG: glycosyltransferase family 4 protein [Thermoflexales bacterium]|nr:glycosyltransferase family 4 protein [Thermoflexales bacterium]
MKGPHQFIIGAAPGDAITDHAFLIQRWLKEDGFDSEIYAESIHPALLGKVKPYREYRPSRPGELVILHHSIGSDLVEDLLRYDVRFLLIYHNITPPDFFQPVDPVLVAQMQRGRRQLGLLRERTVLALGDSSFNEAELQKAGFSPTGVLPIVLDSSQYDLEPNPDLINRYQDIGPRLLFVGRLVPNKKQEDLIKLLYFYRRIEPSARLFLVGPPWVPAYAEWLREFAEELGLGEAVIFTGHVHQRDLVTYYRLADVYVSMSEHEGFGKPLIEAMYLGVPVVAYAAGAVPETMGGAGVLFHQKDYEVLAELIDLVVKSQVLRQRVIQKQRERASLYLEPQVRQVWRGFWEGLNEGKPVR